MALGAALGVALGNIGLGVALGPTVGIVIWAVESPARRSRESDDQAGSRESNEDHRHDGNPDEGGDGRLN